MCAEAERLMWTPWSVNSPRTLEIPMSPLQNSYQKPLFSPRQIHECERRGARYGLVCCHPARVGIPMQEETKTGREENGRGWVDGWVGE